MTGGARERPEPRLPIPRRCGRRAWRSGHSSCRAASSRSSRFSHPATSSLRPHGERLRRSVRAERRGGGTGFGRSAKGPIAGLIDAVEAAWLDVRDFAAGNGKPVGLQQDTFGLLLLAARQSPSLCARRYWQASSRPSSRRGSGLHEVDPERVSVSGDCQVRAPAPGEAAGPREPGRGELCAPRR